jgi:hypothetical protein
VHDALRVTGHIDSTAIEVSMPERVAMVKIAPDDAEAASLWSDFGRLASRVLPAGWTLVGGLMVQLHAYEAGKPAFVPPLTSTYSATRGKTPLRRSHGRSTTMGFNWTRPRQPTAPVIAGVEVSWWSICSHAMACAPIH